MRGTVSKCDLTPSNKSYDYKSTVTSLEDKYGFKNLGEGGFGVVIGNENCAIKIVKDISRCPEMVKEKEIYTAIQQKLDSSNFKSRIPHFSLYEELDDFCHFNIERIFSPLSGWGDIYDDDNYGHGYALTRNDNAYVFNDINTKQLILIDKDKVFPIDRPGNLIHFYINHFDPNTKIKLDNNQGILMGRNYLEKYFTVQKIHEYIREIGKLLAFLISDVRLVPTDIEIVLGSKNKQDREVVPFIYDFNESSLIPSNTNPNTMIGLVARAMYNKNGKNYFPNNKNPYYQSFKEGFIERFPMGSAILDEYNKLF